MSKSDSAPSPSQRSVTHPVKTIRRRPLVAAILWTVFATGLLIQIIAPPLKIENNAFVIPPSLVSGRDSIVPAEIVARERRLRLLSAVTTLAGALSLAFYYRGVLVRSSSS